MNKYCNYCKTFYNPAGWARHLKTRIHLINMGYSDNDIDKMNMNNNQMGGFSNIEPQPQQPQPLPQPLPQPPSIEENIVEATLQPPPLKIVNTTTTTNQPPPPQPQPQPQSLLDSFPIRNQNVKGGNKKNNEPISITVSKLPPEEETKIEEPKIEQVGGEEKKLNKYKEKYLEKKEECKKLNSTLAKIYTLDEIRTKQFNEKDFECKKMKNIISHHQHKEKKMENILDKIKRENDLLKHDNESKDAIIEKQESDLNKERNVNKELSNELLNSQRIVNYNFLIAHKEGVSKFMKDFCKNIELVTPRTPPRQIRKQTDRPRLTVLTDVDIKDITK